MHPRATRGVAVSPSGAAAPRAEPPPFHPELRREAAVLPRGNGGPRTLRVVRRLEPLLQRRPLPQGSILERVGPLRVRVHHPRGAVSGRRAAALWVHGCGYVLGDPAQDDGYCRYLAQWLEAGARRSPVDHVKRNFDPEGTNRPSLADQAISPNGTPRVSGKNRNNSPTNSSSSLPTPNRATVSFTVVPFLGLFLIDPWTGPR